MPPSLRHPVDGYGRPRIEIPVSLEARYEWMSYVPVQDLTESANYHQKLSMRCLRGLLGQLVCGSFLELRYLDSDA